MTNKRKTLFIKLFKYLPPIAAFLLTIHVALLIHDYTIPYTQYLVDSSFLGGGLLIASSVMFNMCKLHKCCIWYTIVVTLLMDLLKMVGLGVLLWPLRYVALAVGLVLCTFIVTKYVKLKKAEKKAKEK